MQIGLAVGDVRGPATLDVVVDQVRAAAGAGFATAWSSQALGWDALTTIAVAGRLTLGVGAGIGAMVEGMFGLPADTEVAQAVARFRDAGATEFMAAPYGTADEQDRTVDLLAELAR